MGHELQKLTTSDNIHFFTNFPQWQHLFRSTDSLNDDIVVIETGGGAGEGSNSALVRVTPHYDDHSIWLKLNGQ